MAQQLFAGLGGKFAKAALAVSVAGSALSNCIYNVEPGHRAIIWSRFGGIRDKVYDEGTHFLIPGIEDPKIIDCRVRARQLNTTTGTKDLQTVTLTLRILSKPNPQALPKIFKEQGYDFDDKSLPSICNEVLKAVVANYNADQLLTLREKVSQDVSRTLEQRAKYFDQLIEDVSITHLHFSRDFTQAIEDKQVAQQTAERAKFEVLKAEQERQAQVIAAEGDAESATLISNAFKEHGRGLIEVRRIETATEVASTLARSRNIVYLPSSGGDSGSNLLLNIGK